MFTIASYLRSINWRNWLFPSVVSVFLIAISFNNFLLFHTTAELFSVCVAVLLCVIAWETYPHSKNNFIMYLACGFFWVGALDLVHTMAYKGMNIFPFSDANPATQFWVATRYLQAFVMLSAPYFLTHKVGRNRSFFAFGVIAVTLYILITSGNFPNAFVEGQGLTAFKVYSEYVIIAMLAGAIAWLIKRRALMTSRVFSLLIFSMLLTMGSELAFTYYVSVYGLSNLVGHIFKIFAFWLIYEAVIRQTLLKPYQQLHEAIESISEGFALFDKDDRLVICNQKYKEIYTACAEAIVPGATFEEIIRFGAERGQFVVAEGEIEEFVRKRIAKHKSANEVMEQHLGDGRWLRIEESRTKDGGTVGIRTDISELKNAEKIILEEKKLAESANQSKSEFLASMSHELRTPLNAVLGFGQMLQFSPNDPLSPNQNEYVENILEGGNHLLELVNEILDLASIEANQLNLSLSDFEANEIVSTCVQLVAPLGDARSIKIIDNFSHGPSVLLFTDRTRLKQVLINLLSNAIKFNKDGGTVAIEGTETDYGYLHISVTDTGVGIAKKDQSSMFDIFHRVDADPMIAREGTGIGLTVTKMLVERMAGRIGVESKEGIGSTFWIDLALASNDDVLIWTDAVNIGVDAIDRDHQVLVSMLNRLMRRSVDDADVDDVISELIEYKKYHSIREEAIMEVYGDPDFDSHRTLHRRLIDDMSQHYAVWRNDRNQENFNLLRKFLKDWLLNHILKDDANIAISAKGKDRDIRKLLADLELTKQPAKSRKGN